MWQRLVIPVFITVVLLPIGLLGAALGFLQTSAGQRWLASQVTAGTGLAMEDFSIAWPLSLRAGKVTITDAGGPWLVAREVVVDWFPEALLAAHLHIRHFTVDRLSLPRLPEQPADGVRQPFRLPVLPLIVQIDDASVDAIEIGPQVFGAAATGRVSAKARLVGDHLTVALLAAGGVAGAEGSARLSVEGRGTRFFVVGNATARDLPRQLKVGAAALALAGGVDLARGTVNVGSLRVQTDKGQAAAFGWAHDWGRAVQVHVSGLVPDLGVISPELQGRARLSGDVSGGLTNLRAAIRMTTEVFSSGDADLDQLLGPAPTLEAAAVLSQGGRPGLLDLRVAGRSASARAGGFLRPLLVGGRLRMDTAEPIAGVPYTGWVEAEGMLLGPESDQLLAARARAEGRLQGHDVAATGMVAARHLEDQPQGRAQMSLTAAGIEAEGAAAFQWGPTVRLDELTVASGSDRVAGHLAWDQARRRVEGALTGQVGALRRWSSLAGVDIGGSARFDVTLSPDQGEQAVLRLQAHDLSYGGVTAREGAIQARLVELFGAPRGDGSVSLGGIGAGRFLIDRARIEASGDLKRMTMNVTAESRGAPAVFLSAAGTAEVEAGRYAVTAMRLTADKEQVRLLAPARLRLKADEIRIETTRIALSRGLVDASGAMVGDKVDGRLDFSGVPLALTAPLFSDWQPSGLLAGRINVSGTRRDPHLTARISGRRLDLGNHGVGGNADVEGAWDGRRAHATLRATGARGGRMTAEADLPLTLAGGQLSFPDGPVSGRVEGHGDLAKLAEFLPMGDQSVGGQLALAATVGGTVQQPDVDAHLDVHQGTYQNFDTGTTLSGIALTATAQDTHRIAIKATGSDGGKGRFTADGQADLDQGPSFQANLAMQDLQVAKLDLIHGAASGNLRIEGTGRNAGVSGNAVVDGADVDIGQALPARIVTLQVVEINRPGPPPAPKPEATQPEFQLALAVGVDLRRIHVRGRGLDSEWKGHLAIGGTADQPSVLGQLTAVRGSYDLFGRRLDLSEGTVTFDGQYPPDPRIDVVAQGQARDVTAQVRVTGTVDKPDFAFTSDPPVPRDEVLARLLFGSDAGQLSVMQQITLARAAAGQITGGAGADFDPLGKLRDVLGLDVLEAGGDTSNDLTAPGMPAVPMAGPGATGPVIGQQSSTRSIGPSLTAGKYLNSRTFLRVDQGTTGGRVTVEVELGGGFAVETRLGEEAGGGVGLSWKKDY